MTYRWSLSDLETHDAHIQDTVHSSGKSYEQDCRVCRELYSILEAMKLTNQSYVYIQGQPEY